MAIRTPEARRLQDLQFSVFGTWIGVGIATMITAGFVQGLQDPTPPGSAEADRVVPWVFFAVAVTWFLCWFPIASIQTRTRVLWWCRIAIFVTGAACVAWLALCRAAE